MSLGPYPAISLAAARQRAAAARALCLEGVDPLDARRAAEADKSKAEQAASQLPTFGGYALALVDDIKTAFSNPKHRAQWRSTLETYCKPIWDNQIDKVDTAGVLDCIKPIWGTKAETASRVRGRIERVLNAARAKGLRSGENPAVWRGHLDSLLPKRAKLTRGHHAALAYAEMPEFMADLRQRDAVAALALEFAILTATRTGETIGARWDEIDAKSGVWTIPASRMKARVEHRVPLSRRAKEILQEAKALKSSDYVFPGRRRGKPLSSMAMLMLLRERRMNRPEITPHGFRSAFSDWASEVSTFSAELRESALAHTIGNKAEAAYRRGDALEKRRKMMEAWAAWCEPKGAANVVALKRRG